MNIGNRKMTRLNYEFKQYQKDQESCNKDGIYLFKSSQVDDVYYGMITGPSDTPYHNGNILIEITFTDLYPFQPPNMKFTSFDSHVRIHPNLYANGYVCLSMINTWGENEYSPGLSLIKILRTIQSILTDNPIEGEPNHEQDKSANAMNYREMVRFDMLRLYVYRITMDHTLEQANQLIPYGVAQQVAPILRSRYLEHYSEYIEVLEKELKGQYNNQNLRANVYSDYNIKLDYAKLIKDFKKLYETFTAMTF